MRYNFNILRLSVIALVIFAAGSAVLAQSGRRSAPTPTPVPVSSDDPTQYSESRSQTRRTSRPLDRPVQTASAPATTTNETPEEEVLKIETNLISIPVSVFDKYGLYIPGLRQSDFKIFENGIEQKIEYFGVQDKPFTVALLIDTSPSAQYKIEEIHAAAEAFVAQLSPQDRVIVIEFHGNVKIQCEATTDREKIIRGIRKAKYGNGTSLYTAVDEAVRKQFSKIEGRKAVVLFTDGVDTTSYKHTYESTVIYAEESDALIFPIYYNTYLENRRAAQGGGGGILGTILGGGGPIMSGVSAAEYALGKRYLDDLAEVTGGRVFRPESTPGGLTKAFEGIAEELRRQYNIGYIPADEGKPGQRKQIKVRVNRPNLIVRARDSYIVGTTR
ncbi:MAG: VWA domain-containing protein [Acidobacteria bacterium]|nr:VWA domain-containing protein [Acidobacteriota bacterium]MBK9529954.1 VWA domain-containing protein [Acidobacteriota bacterium]MBP9109076.1 VWA domain-containing protein [Pyrinomonadaceae bacterium]